MQTPLLLIISGASGVGKSTMSHKLLKMWETPIILETFDLIREAIRGYESEKTRSFYTKDYIIDNVNFEGLLNDSSFNLQLNNFLNQCKILLPALKSICIRLERKNIPVIIEGVNLDPITILTSNITKNYFSLRSNTIFINLHISDKIAYKNQLMRRMQFDQINDTESDYTEKIITRSKELYDRLEQFIINNPHQKNIYNIDISNKDSFNGYINPIVQKIISLI